MRRTTLPAVEETTRITKVRKNRRQVPGIKPTTPRDSLFTLDGQEPRVVVAPVRLLVVRFIYIALVLRAPTRQQARSSSPSIITT